jgi:hypothetical protein
MSTIGVAARIMCQPWYEARARLDAEEERTCIYYIALYSEMEYCRLARIPTLIGEHSIPAAPEVPTWMR